MMHIKNINIDENESGLSSDLGNDWFINEGHRKQKLVLVYSCASTPMTIGGVLNSL